MNSFLLKLLNGNWGIAATALATICAFYLVHETIARGMPAWDWRERFTVGMQVAAALMMLSIGVAVRSAEVYLWRMFSADDLTQLSQFWLMSGGIIALAGFLLCIRVISMRLYGNRPWIWTLVAMGVFTVGSIASYTLLG